MVIEGKKIYALARKQI